MRVRITPLTGYGDRVADIRSSVPPDPNLLADAGASAPTDAPPAALDPDRLASLRELAYGASHEINNPLANIATRAQALLRAETDPERQRSLATIAAQALRAHEMIADLMLFAKPPKLRAAWISLREILQTTVQELAVAFPAHNLSLQPLPAPDSSIRLKNHADPDTGTTSHSPDRPLDAIWADRDQLLVAFAALGRNAFEAIDLSHNAAASRPGHVTFEYAESVASTDATITGWEIRVRDNGPGISDAIAQRIFDPFFSGREAGRGLGFGLSKAWRIIDAHGGHLRLGTEADQLPAGQGSEFVIWLPKSPSPVA
jgi:signal transduction histidine kinase